VAKPRRPSGQAVSLFPFLSILACVIGVLTLMITALALGQINTRSDDERVIRAEGYATIQRWLPTAREKTRELQRQVADAQDVEQQLAALEAELEPLRKLLDGSRANPKAAATDLQAEAKRLQDRREKLQAQIGERRKALVPLQQEIARRGQPPESEVVIQPGGSGTAADLQPRFVEANATGIVLYDADTPRRVPSGDVAADAAFLKLCKDVAASPKAILIFLIRSDGYGTFGHADGVARAHGARTGKLPVLGQGRIDLRLFRKPK